MLKTLPIALFIVSVFLGTPAVLIAEIATKDMPAPVMKRLITEQDIKLMQQDIRDQRRQIVAANLPLSTEESAKFWPVYDQFITEVSKILDGRFAQINDYAAHYDTMDDKQAAEYISKLFGADKSMTDLRVKYQPAFEKVLSKKKAAMFLQMDRRIQLMIDLQRASQIPLINPK